MKKFQATAALLATAALVTPALAISAAGQTVQLSATLTPKDVVTPANKSWSIPTSLKQARGNLSASVSPDGKKLTWRISYSNLGQPALVIADIHVGASGKFGPILVRLCGPCTSGQSGVKTLKPGALATFKAGNTWATLITNKYPNGAVRGQIRGK
jgi:hypothetical protein